MSSQGLVDEIMVDARDVDGVWVDTRGLDGLYIRAPKFERRQSHR